MIALGPLVLLISVAADVPVPAIETIRNAYLAAITSIFTLDCEMSLDFELIKPDPLNSPDTIYTSASVHLWRKGNWRALQVESMDGNHAPATVVWYGFDGSHYGRWTKSLRPSDQQDWLPGGVIQTEKDNDLYEYFTIDRLTGETLSAGDLSLGRLLSDPGAIIVGRKVISGVACVEVTFPRHMVGRKYPQLKTVQTTAWLDPAHGYLPRLIRREIYPEEGSKSPRLFEFETTGFRTVVGLDQRQYTLPSTGEYRNSVAKTRLRLINAAVNGPLEDRFFKPEFPAMSEVVRTLADQPTDRFIVGDPSEHKRAHDAIVAKVQQRESPKSSSISAPAPSARPRTSPGWGWLRFAVALLIVGGAYSGVRIWRSRL